MDTADPRLVETPVVWSVATPHLKKVCSFCLKKAKDDQGLLRCSRCHTMHYCGKECQKDDWIDHKFECKRFEAIKSKELPTWVVKRCPDFPSDGIRILARLVLKIKREGEENLNSQDRCYSNLISHSERIMADEKSREIFDDISHLYAHFIGVGSDEVNREKLVTHYGKLIVNQFAIKDSGLQTVGLGLYVSLCRLDHSCDPSGRVVFQGKRAVVIPVINNTFAGDWLTDWDTIVENINHSYIDNLAKKSDRQSLLRKCYQFSCECNGCCDVTRNESMESWQCLETNGCTGKVVSVSKKDKDAGVDGDYVCVECRALASVQDINTANNIAHVATQALQKLLQSKTIIGCEKMFEICSKSAAMQEGVLHPLNVDRMLTLRHAFESAVALGKWKDAMQYGFHVLTVYNEYLGSFDPWRSSFALNLAVACLNCGRKNEAELLLTKALPIQTHAFGKDSEPVQYANMLMIKATDP